MSTECANRPPLFRVEVLMAGQWQTYRSRDTLLAADKELKKARRDGYQARIVNSKGEFVSA